MMLMKLYWKKILVGLLLMLLFPLIASLTLGNQKWTIWMPVLAEILGYLLACIFVLRDPRQKDQPAKVLNLLFWIFPLLSALSCLFSVFMVQNQEADGFLIMNAGFGVFFVIMGNIMPKIRPNSTFGARYPWAMENDQLWAMSNRITGRIFFVCGLLMLVSCFLPAAYMVSCMLLLIVIACCLSALLSWMKYRQWVKEGKVPPVSRKKSRMALAMGVLLSVLMLVCLLLVLGGNLEVKEGTDAITITATLTPSRTIDYRDIEEVRLEKAFYPGTRVFGVGTANLKTGTFENDSLGTYTLYMEGRQGNPAVILTCRNGNTVVISLESAEQTETLFRQIEIRSLLDE